MGKNKKNKILDIINWGLICVLLCWMSYRWGYLNGQEDILAWLEFKL